MNESIKRAQVGQATIPMAVLARDGTILSSSPSWNCRLGAPSTGWSALVADSDQGALDAIISASSKGQTIEVGLPGDDWVWFGLQATPLGDGDEVLVIATDVTSAHKRVAELEERVEFVEWQALSLSTFGKLMGSARLILFAVDQRGVTTMSDGKGLELLGQKPGERVGRNELDATRETPENEYLRRALGGETLRVLVEAAPGIYFDTWYLPQRDEQDQPAGVIGLAIDATDRVRSEQRLAEKVEIVARQDVTIRTLAAPIIKVWSEVVCMPIIGAVDAERAGDMMARLLEAIVRDKARYAILDLTGVDVMDTPTVQHMLKIFAAARTVGVEAVLSGVRPAVAQSVVSLGVDLRGLRMMRTLHDALAWCIEGSPAGHL